MQQKKWTVTVRVFFFPFLFFSKKMMTGSPQHNSSPTNLSSWCPPRPPFTPFRGWRSHLTRPWLQSEAIPVFEFQHCWGGKKRYRDRASAASKTQTFTNSGGGKFELARGKRARARRRLRVSPASSCRLGKMWSGGLAVCFLPESPFHKCSCVFLLGWPQD